ncbi:hypothetical protein [Tropicimonas isoalkanivorans]|uniref:Uncharacterized protein n=1 Tax=Tropicimonas isoalkanivorans TaxID=441112 RepID=A0A1I1P2C7_9RHOB|nr:hypothetical protein [Tropicimonas isoalkanivorans]SFD03836.1 hypothetical protein SAMN04488094_113145 [Tropicimonas isoalkanivorans]
METGAKTQTSPELMEGRLLAQRKVLAALVTAVLEDGEGGRSRLRTLVALDSMEGEHEEDPGADPDAAYAVEAAIHEELRLIAEAVAAQRNVT